MSAMSTPTNKPDVKRTGSDPLQKPTQLFAHPLKVSKENTSEIVSGSVLDTQPDNELPLFPPVPLREHPEPHRGYVFASLVLSGGTCVLSLASIAVAAVTIYNASHYETTEEGQSLFLGMTIMFVSLEMAESILCFAATLTCFALLFCKPHRVLVRNPCNGSFVCLCVSFFLLFLFCIYSCAIQAWLGCTSKYNDAPPSGVCAVHCVRAVGLLSFFAVLVANSKVLPHDPLM